MIRAIALLLIWSLSVPYVSATTFAWMSASAFLGESDLIAIVDVSSVHEVTTPEGFRLQSAKATIVKEIFRRFPTDSQTKSNSIIIYSFDAHAAVTDDNLWVDGFAFPITEGKAFVCLKGKGVEKYYPYEPLSFQKITNSDKVMWPSAPVYREGMPPYVLTPVPVVIDELNELQKQNNPNRAVHLTPMPSALLARRLRSSLGCQKQVGAGDSRR